MNRLAKAIYLINLKGYRVDRKHPSIFIYGYGRDGSSKEPIASFMDPSETRQAIFLEGFLACLNAHSK